MESCPDPSKIDFNSLSTEALTSLLAGVPKSDVEGQEKETLVAMAQLGTAKYTIETWWAPEIFAIAIFFGIVVFLKLGLQGLMSSAATKQAAAARHRLYAALNRHADHTDAQHGAEEKKNVRQQEADAESVLRDPARAMLCHVMNLTLSTIALILQLVGWRLFILNSTVFRFIDIQCFTFAVKILLAAYAADLAFGNVGWPIVFHHVATFALLICGEISATKTMSPKFFRMAQWLLLQATVEQSTYAAMAAYHYSKYLAVRGPDQKRQQISFLGMSVKLLWFTRFITYPQKLVPVVLAFYWNGRMWTEIDEWFAGRFWLGWSTGLITLLVVVQIHFCDEVFSLYNSFQWKLAKLDPDRHQKYLQDHTTPPPPTGPVMALLFGRFKKKSSAEHSTSARPPSRTGSGRSSRSPRAASGVLGRQPSTRNELSKSRRRRSYSRYDEEKAELFSSDSDGPSSTFKKRRSSKSYGRVGDYDAPSDAQTDSEDETRPPSYRSRRSGDH